MSQRRVSPDSALRWFADAFRTVFANPSAFLPMGLVVAIIAMVPVFGGLALAILGPALYGGIVYAAREQQAGRPAAFEQLFLAFRQPGKLPRMLLLCLPGLLAGIVVVFLLVMLVGDALVGAGASATSDAEALAAAMGAGGVVFFVLALVIGLAAYSMVFFALPQIMLADADPVPAMRDSLQACMTNIGAFGLFVGLLLVGAIALSLLLGWLPDVIAQLLAMTLLVPVVSCALYFAWRDVYGDDAGAAHGGTPSIEV